MGEQANNGKGYIHDDIHGKPFFWFSVGFAVFSVLSVVVVTLFYRQLTAYHERNQGEVPTRVETGRIVPPEPMLQADPVADMVAMDRAQSALLDSYGWVDKNSGVARIPIDDAIAITLERSLVRAQLPATASAQSALESPQNP